MIPLEDTFADIIAKAQRGLGLSDSALADEAGIPTTKVAELKAGAVDAEAIARIAGPLNLKSAALVALAQGAFSPGEISVDGLLMFNTPWKDMRVNAYLVFDPTSKKAAAFDSGADATPMIEAIRQHQLEVAAIFITHTHGDHVFEIDRLIEATAAPAFVSEKEPFAGAEPFAEGRKFSIGPLSVETRLTSGHSVGGTTYVVRGLSRPLAVVGDALFAASMGGGMISWADALANNRKKILTLPPETVLCPGHGPLTSVAIELEHNPCFP